MKYDIQDSCVCKNAVILGIAVIVLVLSTPASSLDKIVSGPQYAGTIDDGMRCYKL